MKHTPKRKPPNHVDMINISYEICASKIVVSCCCLQRDQVLIGKQFWILKKSSIICIALESLYKRQWTKQNVIVWDSQQVSFCACFFVFGSHLVQIQQLAGIRSRKPQQATQNSVAEPGALFTWILDSCIAIPIRITQKQKRGRREKKKNENLTAVVTKKTILERERGE